MTRREFRKSTGRSSRFAPDRRYVISGPSSGEDSIDPQVHPDLGIAIRRAWDYRASRWAEYDKTAPEGCPIKGNVNSHGERIYHMPWGRDYAKVKMDLTKGKHWFCSEGEAEKAGWRAAR